MNIPTDAEEWYNREAVVIPLAAELLQQPDFPRVEELTMPPSAIIPKDTIDPPFEDIVEIEAEG